MDWFSYWTTRISQVEIPSLIYSQDRLKRGPERFFPQSPLSILLLSSISFLSGFSFNPANWTLLLLRLAPKLIIFFVHYLLRQLRHTCLLGRASPAPSPVPCLPRLPLLPHSRHCTHRPPLSTDIFFFRMFAISSCYTTYIFFF